ncbi:MAG: hypothetical protein ASARMPREDX12_003294 [Alectoria sarmentosa]|nr:MAG: hypothetical protein ASARMPREDX12_003294 [Alectoria sarmentosa]
MFHKKEHKAVITEESLNGVSIPQESNTNRLVKALRSRLRCHLGRHKKVCRISSARDLDDGATHAEAVEASSHTTSIGADVVSSPEGYASNESGEDGQAITSTVEGSHHVTEGRSAPAPIQGGPSPAKSAISEATLLNSPRRASPLTPRTPVRLTDAEDIHIITTSPSLQQDLSSTDEGISQCHSLVEQLQADLAIERENAQHDRGVAQQALVEAQDDIADLEAEVSDLKDQLEIEKQSSQNFCNNYHRCDRDATSIITNCHERISKLEADLNHEQHKARHNYSEAEQYMGLAESWRDAFHHLGHNPEALWKMLVEELRVRGVVFDYYGHLRGVGLRKAILGAENVDEWVAGLGDRRLLNPEASKEHDCQNATVAMTTAGDTVVGGRTGASMLGEMNIGRSQPSAEEKIAEEDQADAEADEERAAEKDGHFDLNNVVEANCINEQAQKCMGLQSCGPEPLVSLIDVSTGEAILHNQRHGVCQGSDTVDLVVGDQEEFGFLEVEDRAHVENIASNCDLADVSDGTPSRLLNPQISSLGLRNTLPLPTMGNGLLTPLLWSH